MNPVCSHPWSIEEDSIISSHIETFGEQLWVKCAQQLTQRTGKQVRERWREVLRPGIDKESWTVQQDKQILNMWKQIGTKWKQMSNTEILWGKTENQIKNRFNAFIKKYLIDEEDDPQKNVNASNQKENQNIKQEVDRGINKHQLKREDPNDKYPSLLINIFNAPAESFYNQKFTNQLSLLSQNPQQIKFALFNETLTTPINSNNENNIQHYSPKIDQFLD
eukprot:TRINITY_DN9527_c0_g1_i1.p2 TRINITY_DN9527_c0_g1~~TRINITY_DN9527_c0_g1_i1.p2  ORF type:complete len:221 (-),score=35.67 TRINITY_DN9527_c0_g1_i1:38-700(-)